MKRGSKKGLSPVIATTFLVMFVLILAAIVFMWARGFIQEQVQKGGQLAEEVCKAVKFDATFTDPQYDDHGNTEGTLSIINRGNYPIHGFDIKGIDGGSSKIDSYAEAVNPGDTIPSKTIIVSKKPKEIIIYPKILGSVEKKKTNREVACLDSGVRIKIEI